MPEFHDIFLFFSSVRIPYRGCDQDGWKVGGGVGWEVPKNFGAVMLPKTPTQWPMPHYIVGHRDVQSAVRAILSPHHIISVLHWCYFSSHDFGGLAKCPLEKQTS